MEALKKSTKSTYVSGQKRMIELLETDGPMFKTAAENVMQNVFRCSVKLLHKMHTDGVIRYEDSRYHYHRPYDKLDCEQRAEEYHVRRQTR